MRIEEEKIELHKTICVRDISFLAARAPSDVVFCRLFRFLRFYVEKNFSPENGMFVCVCWGGGACVPLPPPPASTDL